MTIIDALIIYLTLGAPVSVYRLLGEHGRPVPSTIVRLALSLLFWPLFVGNLFRIDVNRSIKNEANAKVKSADIDIRAMEKNVAKAITTAVVRNISVGSRAGISKAAEQYAGLMISDARSSITPAFRDLFEISDHPNAKMAAVCLSRKNKHRLRSHLFAAKNNLLIELKAALSETADKNHLIRKAAHISAFFGDKELARSIRSLRDQTVDTVIAHAELNILR